VELLLTKLTPEQISDYGDYIREAIPQTFNGNELTYKDKLKSILTSLYAGVMVCFLVQTPQGDVKALIIVRELFDDITEVRSLLIYGRYSFKAMSEEEWIDVLFKLKKYAIALGCFNVMGYIGEKFGIALAKKMGAQLSVFFNYPLVEGV
jgi:hypothetical protein